MNKSPYRIITSFTYHNQKRYNVQQKINLFFGLFFWSVQESFDNLEDAVEYITLAVREVSVAIEYDSYNYMNKKSKIIKTGVDDNEHY